MGTHITFVIEYDPFEGNVQFSTLDKADRVFQVQSGEDIKEYENNEGIFSLEGQYELIFNYLKKEYYTEPEIIVRVKVTRAGYEKKITEIDRFRKAVAKFNKDNKLRLLLEVDKTDSDQEQDKQTIHIPKHQLSIAVIGMIGSGKTELILGMVHNLGSATRPSVHGNGVTLYTDDKNGMSWYEVDGIEMEKYSVDRIKWILHQLIKKDGVSEIVYCLNGIKGKMEDIERDFIVEIRHEYPHIKIIAVVTYSLNEASCEFAQQISITTMQTKTFAVLARKIVTVLGNAEPYGLDELANELRGIP